MTSRSLLPFLLFSSLALAQEPVAPTAPVAPVAPAAPAADPIGDALAERIVHVGIEQSQVHAILKSLTHDVGQRLTGSDNFTKACEWAAERFRAMGLENVHLDPWGEWKLTWNRGPWVGRIVSPVELEMYVATEAWTAGTDGLQKGRVVMAPRRLPNTASTNPSSSSGDGEPDGDAERPADGGTATDDVAPAVDYRGTWVLSQRLPRASIRKALAEAGVLGFVYRARDPDEDYPTRVRVFGDHRTAMKPFADVPTVPEIAVRADHYEQLRDLVEGGQEVFCEFDIQNSFRDEPIVLHNVIAEIPGTEKPDEVVIVSAHLDSWHQAQGTTDNGTGTATTIEAARILKAVGAAPKRTIRFCLWGGEEQGLLGSRGYVQKNRTAMPQVSALFNHDTGTNWAQSLAVTAAMQQQLAPVFAHVTRLLQPPDADWQDEVFTLRVVPRVSGGGGSDHASFLAAGVPGLDWGLKGRSDYFRHTWHTQWDTFDVAIEEYQRHTATVVALAALGTANLDALLDRENVGGGGGGGQAQAIAEAFFGAKFDGMKLGELEAEGRAAKLGLSKGDVLIEAEGQEVERVYEIFRIARDVEGDELTFTFRRGDERVTVKAPKSDLPQRRSRQNQAPRDTVPTPQDGSVVR